MTERHLAVRSCHVKEASLTIETSNLKKMESGFGHFILSTTIGDIVII